MERSGVESKRVRMNSCSVVLTGAGEWKRVVAVVDGVPGGNGDPFDQIFRRFRVWGHAIGQDVVSDTFGEAIVQDFHGRIGIGHGGTRRLVRPVTLVPPSPKTAGDGETAVVGWWRT